MPAPESASGRMFRARNISPPGRGPVDLRAPTGSAGITGFPPGCVKE